jgi:hypothetical protein
MLNQANSCTAMRTPETEASYIETVFLVLQERGVKLELGLTGEEVVEIQRTHDLHFPPDLRAFLLTKLPAGNGFPDWRGSAATIREMLARPIHGVCFDIEYNGFWFSEWGTRPLDLAEALAVANRALALVPKLIPVYKHRYISSEPEAAGNPVLSMYQTDIIPYGNDLAGYFEKEFGVPLPKWAASAPREIRFWDDVVLLNAQRD